MSSSGCTGLRLRLSRSDALAPGGDGEERARAPTAALQLTGFAQWSRRRAHDIGMAQPVGQRGQHRDEFIRRRYRPVAAVQFHEKGPIGDLQAERGPRLPQLVWDGE